MLSFRSSLACFPLGFEKYSQVSWYVEMVFEHAGCHDSNDLEVLMIFCPSPVIEPLHIRKCSPCVDLSDDEQDEPFPYTEG